MSSLHQGLSPEKWSQLSLCEQLGNIGSEIGRSARWQGKDKEAFEGAVLRGLELLDMTLEDPRWKGRRKEIARVREIFCDIVWGEGSYKTTLADLENYFYPYALAARQRI